MNTLDISNQQGKKIDKIKLDAEVFNAKINLALMRQATVIYLANQRKGLAQCLKRGEVSGGGKKPWRQKGTGRARVGSIRSPLWRGGGITFGPRVRDYSKALSRRMKALALQSALNAKLRDKEIIVLENIKVDSFKTKNLYNILSKLELEKQRIKFVVEQIDDNLKKAARNLPKVDLEKAVELSTYGALDCSKLVFTVVALKQVQERLKKWVK